uniref:Uncharacterized protein n=1 Tax=Branchiostoma floridae TaxID=7739 RepID=C3ZEI7_BRAFL|eukprot:XP_002593132.1 hypothetical protein BRAFLDRAFT_72781 [Branchiostoma floridae]
MKGRVLCSFGPHLKRISRSLCGGTWLSLSACSPRATFGHPDQRDSTPYLGAPSPLAPRPLPPSPRCLAGNKAGPVNSPQPPPFPQLRIASHRRGFGLKRGSRRKHGWQEGKAVDLGRGRRSLDLIFRDYRTPEGCEADGGAWHAAAVPARLRPFPPLRPEKTLMTASSRLGKPQSFLYR